MVPAPNGCETVNPFFHPGKWLSAKEVTALEVNSTVLIYFQCTSVKNTIKGKRWSLKFQNLRTCFVAVRL